MWFFGGKKRVETSIKRLNSSLISSFTNVKRDTSLIFQWLNQFYAIFQRQDSRLYELEQQFLDVKSHFLPQKDHTDDLLNHEIRLKELEKQPKAISHAEIKQIIDQYYDHDVLVQRIIHLQSKLNEIRLTFGNIQSLPQQYFDLKARIDALERKKTTVQRTFRERVIQNITKQSKEYIKSTIISLIRKYDTITGLQLKEMIVEEQGLCSKSSFYRILGEIEQEQHEISVVWEGKEKRYFAKLTKTA